MSIRTAWDKIAEDYKRAVKEGRSEKHYVYEEMYITSDQLKAGFQRQRLLQSLVPGAVCGSIYEAFQVIRAEPEKWFKNLRETLRLEMADAFEQRKAPGPAYG